MATEASTGRSDAYDRLLNAVVEHVAQQGIGDQSLRQIATAVGTSHRMLLYHFGSKEGLLSEVVRTVEERQRSVFRGVRDEDQLGTAERGRKFWSLVTQQSIIYGPLFFELAGQAMQGRSHALTFLESLVDPWVDELAALWVESGLSPADARVRARLSLGTARGLMFDLLVTGDVTGVTEAMDLFVDWTERDRDVAT
ncbi:MAG: TetR/AcrR family transcriptional regulator [Nocardioidaceae bacterium]